MTIYITGTRYPDDSVDISVEDAQQAIVIAEKVKEFVLEKIKR